MDWILVKTLVLVHVMNKNYSLPSKFVGQRIQLPNNWVTTPIKWINNVQWPFYQFISSSWRWSLVAEQFNSIHMIINNPSPHNTFSCATNNSYLLMSHRSDDQFLITYQLNNYIRWWWMGVAMKWIRVL